MKSNKTVLVIWNVPDGTSEAIMGDSSTRSKTGRLLAQLIEKNM